MRDAFISQSGFQRLGLSSQPFHVSVHGVGNCHARFTQGLTSFIIQTKQNGSIRVKCIRHEQVN